MLHFPATNEMFAGDAHAHFKISTNHNSPFKSKQTTGPGLFWNGNARFDSIDSFAFLPSLNLSSAPCVCVLFLIFSQGLDLADGMRKQRRKFGKFLNFSLILVLTIKSNIFLSLILLFVVFFKLWFWFVLTLRKRPQMSDPNQYDPHRILHLSLFPHFHFIHQAGSRNGSKTWASINCGFSQIV